MPIAALPTRPVKMPARSERELRNEPSGSPSVVEITSPVPALRVVARSKSFDQPADVEEADSGRVSPASQWQRLASTHKASGRLLAVANARKAAREKSFRRVMATSLQRLRNEVCPYATRLETALLLPPITLLIFMFWSTTMEVQGMGMKRAAALGTVANFQLPVFFSATPMFVCVIFHAALCNVVSVSDEWLLASHGRDVRPHLLARKSKLIMKRVLENQATNEEVAAAEIKRNPLFWAQNVLTTLCLMVGMWLAIDGATEVQKAWILAAGIASCTLYPLVLLLVRNLAIGILRREGESVRVYVKNVLHPRLFYVLIFNFVIAAKFLSVCLSGPIVVPTAKRVTYEDCVSNLTLQYIAENCQPSFFQVAPLWQSLGTPRPHCVDKWSDPYESLFDACASVIFGVEMQSRGAAGVVAACTTTLGLLLSEMILLFDRFISAENFVKRSSPLITCSIWCLCVSLAFVPLCLSILFNDRPYLIPAATTDKWAPSQLLGLYVTLTCVMFTSLATIMLTAQFCLKKWERRKGDLQFWSRDDTGSPHQLSVRQEMQSIIARDKVDLDRDGKMAGDVSNLITGRPADAALGINAILKVSSRFEMPSIDTGVERIVHEFDQMGTAIDKECLDYVLNKRAGTSTTQFQENLCRDCDSSGNVLPSRLNRMGRKRLHQGLPAPAAEYGLLLDDFVNHESSVLAGLQAPHVLALRLYTTAAFQSLNTPLRDRSPGRDPHPFPSTVKFLDEGINQLRAVEANMSETATSEIDLFRGMRNLRVLNEFLRHGGAELAPMSTSSDLSVAVRYAYSPNSLLLKIKTRSFMDRGADISFLSAFPAEKEFLYAPLTYLRPTMKTFIVADEAHNLEFTVVEVEPQR